VMRAGYVMRLFELGLGDFYMMDSMWVLLLSTTTVGYGDIYPVTDAGRIVLVLNQFLGVVVLSTLVAVLQSTLSLSNRFVCHPLYGMIECKILKFDIRENLLVTNVTRLKVITRP
jgi:hypothetical protein